MIYSKWKPSKGGYDYFKANDKDVPLGDDLPTPVLPAGTAIGVASTEAGRAIPSGAKHVGSGEQAIGLISPIEKSVLGSIGAVMPHHYCYMAAGVFLGWLVFKKDWGRDL
jgi:hypothetical protein